jgi:cysteine desulfurase
LLSTGPRQRVYLDHAATSPLTPEALQAMQPWLQPSRISNASALHAEGRAARAAIDDARGRLASALGCHDDELLFLGSGTEADNLAIAGLIQAAGDRPHLVTSAIEHPAVLRCARRLEQRGDCELSVVAPEADGRIAPDAVLAALRPGTALVSLMAVNNETGVVQPVAELAGALRERGVPLHVDAVQAAGRFAVDADLLSYSAHKVGGPPGCGLLLVRRGLKLQPLLNGGGQEEGLRPGTESVAMIAGGSAALVQAFGRRPDPSLADLAERLETGLTGLPGCTIAGAGADRVPGLITAGFAGAEGATLLQALDLRGFSVSTGSACTSGSTLPSHVLTGMGWPPEAARSAIRLSLGPGNAEADVDRLLAALKEVLDAVRSEVRS